MKNRRKLNFSILLALLIITSCKKEEASKRVDYFKVTGVVLNRATNLPIDSVVVQLNYTDWFTPNFFISKTVTDNKGRFEIEHRPNPDKSYVYNLTFDKFPYHPTKQYVDLYKREQDYVIIMLE